MNYQQCLEYLNRLGNEVLTMKFGLETMRALLRALENPERNLPVVLVAGTNGKGSTAHFLHSILVESGLRTGLYTSPHLIRVEERIAVNRSAITSDQFAEALSRVVKGIARLGAEVHPTFFETLTAAAFCHFGVSDLDLAVLEVGMGGRLDSTNVMERPLVSVITPVGLDHCQYLGETLQEIAFEKGGIIHEGCPVLLAPQKEAAGRVLQELARSRGCPCEVMEERRLQVNAEPDGRCRLRVRGETFHLATYGHFQAWNAALAVEAAHQLIGIGLPVTERGIRNGIETTAPPNSLVKVGEGPAVFLDGGHNPEAARAVAAFIRDHTRPPRSLVWGMMRDKDLQQFIEPLAPLFSSIFPTSVTSERAASLEQLCRVCPGGIPVEDPGDAFGRAIEESNTVLVAGSIYLVGELMKKLQVPAERIAGRAAD